jgi:hypothetical protein
MHVRTPMAGVHCRGGRVRPWGRVMESAENRRAGHLAALERISRLRVTRTSSSSPLPSSSPSPGPDLGARTSVLQAELAAAETRSFEDTEAGIAALERLLAIAEAHDSGQVDAIAGFLGALFGDGLLDLRNLRGVDEDIGQDMMSVLQAFMRARISVENMAEDAERRVRRILERYPASPKPGEPGEPGG